MLMTGKKFNALTAKDPRFDYREKNISMFCYSGVGRKAIYYLNTFGTYGNIIIAITFSNVSIVENLTNG